MLRWTLLLCLSLALSGCDRISAAFIAEPNKINQAFPLSIELEVAQARLLMEDSYETANKARRSDAFGQLLVVRALACAGTTPIGRFDTVAEIQRKIQNPECFKKQDRLLADWIGLQRVSIALRRPPLRPLTELPQQTTFLGLGSTVFMTTAMSANIAVAKSDIGLFTVLDLAGNKPIQSFQAPMHADRPAMLSPNGRLLSVPISNRSLGFFDTESASLLWSTDTYNDVVAWIPEVGALVLNENNGNAVLVDMQTGSAEPYVATEKNLSWSQSVPNAASKRLIGGQSTAWLIDHARRGDGRLVASVVQQWSLKGMGVTASTTMLMRNGSLLVYLAMRDLGWLDLATGEQGSWAISTLDGYGFSKLNESGILYIQRARAASPATYKLLDVTDLSVATVTDGDAENSAVLGFAPRPGYAKRQNQTVVVRSMAQTSDPQPLDRLLAQADLERQLGKLQTPAPPNPAQVPNGSPAAAVEAAIAAIRMSAIAQGIAVAPPNPAPITRPLLTQIPSNARVAVIGVYQARNTGPSKSNERVTGVVRVSVAPGPTPLVLVLSNYEPVRWLIDNSNGRTLSAVLMSGYYPSTVIGASQADVLKIGSNAVYKMGTTEYESLKTDVGRYLSNPITSFQGSYEGQDFQVRN